MNYYHSRSIVNISGRYKGAIWVQLLYLKTTTVSIITRLFAKSTLRGNRESQCCSVQRGMWSTHVCTGSFTRICHYVNVYQGLAKIRIASWILVFSFLCLNVDIGVRGEGSAAPLSWKISGQAQDAQKSWMIKNILTQWKFSGQLVFFRASASCSKVLNEKNISIQGKFSGQLCFSGQAQDAQKFWMIKNIYSMQWIQGTFCFSGQAQDAQKSWM